MDIREIVTRCEPESRHLKYVPKGTETQSIVETVVGMSNAEGGTVVVGGEVGKNRRPRSFTDVESRCSIVDEMEQELTEGVAPPLECRTELFRVGGAGFIAFTVPPSDRLRSIHDETSGKPVFPTRSWSENTFLSGNNIDHFLELSPVGPS